MGKKIIGSDEWYTVFLCAVVRLVMILFSNGKQKDREEEINVVQDLKTVLSEGIIYYIF